MQGALRLFLRAVESCLRAHSPGAGPAARLGAVACIHRFGSTLNTHLHFHCVVIDGVFDAAAAEPAHRRAARYAWALLLARIYEVFPLVCPLCGGAMRIIAFITDAPTVDARLCATLGLIVPAPSRARSTGPPARARLPRTAEKRLHRGVQPSHFPVGSRASPLATRSPAS